MSIDVAVNLLWCVPGQVGGSEEYLVRQLLGLAEVAPEWRPVGFAPLGFAAAHPDLAAVCEIREASIDGVSRPRRIATEATWLRQRTAGAALRHHGGGTAPTGAQRPYVLTIHDLQYRTYPQHFGRLKRAYLDRTMPRAARAAAAIVVPTEYVRGTVIDAYELDPLGVVVVPHGVESDLLAEVTPADELRRRYALGDGPVVVYPAVTNPHKNHAFLIDLLRSRWTDPDLRLVLIGGTGSAEDIVTACTDRRVCRLGRVPAADRNGLIALAEALVFPSRYEGFGAPLIEAMTLGSPVIAAATACIPEVVGDAGLVEPLDLDAWAGALETVRARRTDLVGLGRRRAERFTAARSGAALASTYALALERGVTAERPLRLAVLCPHFAPDSAPTGEVITAIVHELADRGHELHVVTALPWYRHHAVEVGWTGRLVRHETTPWGSITRVDPFAGRDKRSIARRAAGFIGFSALAGAQALRGGQVDGVLAMSPPFTMGLTGWAVHMARRGPLVYNVQDVFPDAAIATGAITDRRMIAVARWVERQSYARSAAVTAVGEEMRANIAAKMPAGRAGDVVVIPNFVDTAAIRPLDRHTELRRRLGIGPEPVVMYAGNIGYSQSLDMVVDVARRMPDVTFLVNGGGSGLPALVERAAGVANVRFNGYEPKERVGEVLATGDVHLVPLRAGLASVSVPSKTYAVLAAGRPVVASIDPGTEVPRLLAESGAGVAIAPDDVEALHRALVDLLADERRRAAMGATGRAWAEAHASPLAAATAYEALFRRLYAPVTPTPERAPAQVASHPRGPV